MKNERDLARKNIEVSFEFSRYLLSNPTLAKSIPDDALLVFEIADDPDLTAFNRSLAKRSKTAGQPVVIIHIKGLAPTRLLEPTVTRVRA